MNITRAKNIWIVAAICTVLCLAAIAVFLPVNTALAYDSYYQDEGGFDDSVFTALDYGLYWYDLSSPIPKKAGTAGANFDAQKPTVIFTHGMKINEGYNRRDLVSLWGATNGEFAAKGYDEYMYEEQYYQVLLQAGYNVGHFYWNQLAEISIDQDVRIWTSDIEGDLSYSVVNARGEKVMGDSQYNPTDSVAVLFGNALVEGLGASYDKPWRLVGHSMGGQLVLATAQNLVHQQKTGKIGANLVPERVSLIDPYLCNTATTEGMRLDHMDGAPIAEGTWTAELAASALEEIADYGVAVDAYGGTQFVYRNYVAMVEIQMAPLAADLRQLKLEAAEYEDVDGYATLPEYVALSQEIAALQADYDALKARHTALTERLGKTACWTHLDALADKYGATSHCMIIDYYFTTMYEPEQTDNFGTALPSCTSTTEYIRSLRGFNFSQKLRADSTANPFYRSTTDFVRCDYWRKSIPAEQAGVLYGIVDGYHTAELLDAQTGEAVQSARISSAGEYHFYNVADGDYKVRYTAEDAVAQAEVSVDASAKALGTIAESDVHAVTQTEDGHNKDALVFALVVTVACVALILMVVFIVLAAKAGKNLRQQEEKAQLAPDDEENSKN